MAKGNMSKKPVSEEEYTTNKVLTVFSVCLLGVLVLMIVQRLLNYASSWQAGMVTVRVLLGVGIVGIVWGLYLLAREHAGKREAARHIICGRNVLIISVILAGCMAVVHYLGTQPIKGFYVVLPVLAVYYLVYHSYAPEFFLIAADCGIAVGLMWVAHRAANSASFGMMGYVALAGAAVLAAIQIAAMVSLRRRKGRFTFRGKAKNARFSGNAYTILMVTPLVMVALIAVPVFAPALTLAAMGAAAAYLFVTAVYYTVKLM